MDIEKLESIGFTENLAKIYLTLFEFDELRAGQIINKTKLQRSVVYSGLEELVGRGLVTKIVKKGVFSYFTNNPEALISEAEKNKLRVEKISNELAELKDKQKREVFVYEGDDMIEMVAKDSLKIDGEETVYFLGPSKFGAQGNIEKFWSSYHKIRVKRGIKSKILYDKSTPKEILENRNKLEMSEAKYLPFGSNLPIWFNIFGENTAIIVPGEDPPLTFFIKSQKTADAMREYFDFLWQASK